MENKRYIWVDYAKVISIFLVVYFHSKVDNTAFIDLCLKELRMPAFFLMAGFLFNIERFDGIGHLAIHRARRLVFPYFVFAIAYFAFWAVYKYPTEGDESLIGPLLNILKGNPNEIVAIMPYWFLCCLFVMQVMYYVICKIIPQKYVFLFVLLLSIAYSILDISVSLPNIWNIGAALGFMPFYAFANQYKSFLGDTNFRRSGVVITLLAAVSICLVYAINSFAINPYLMHPLHLCAGLFVLPLYICFCKGLAAIIKSREIIKLYGDNTIVILLTHCFLIKAVHFILGESNSLLVTLLVFALSYIPIKLIGKWCPEIIGRKRRNTVRNAV